MIVTIAKPLRDVGPDTFTDLTTVPVTSVSWGADGLIIDFAGTLTVPQIQRVRLRCVTATAADEAQALTAYQAIATNDDFLALAAPTQAQVLAQVKLLTRETSALIRVVLSGAQ